VQNLGECFGGCGRVKNNFAVKDASFMFHLQTVLVNVLVDFGLTFAQLAARPGVAEQWAAHITCSERGNTPRAQWRRDAEQAVALLRSDAYAGQPVLFICEAQMTLRHIYEVRSHMHEVSATPPAAALSGAYLSPVISHPALPRCTSLSLLLSP
jgi:hypothetical protein